MDRLATRRALRSTGLEASVDEATDADGALAILREGRHDLVLLDYMLPGHDGLWLLREARAAGLDLAVVMLTGQGDELLAVELMRAGASDYLPKAAMDPEQLRRAVLASLRLSAAERRASAAREFERQLIGIVSHDLRNPLQAIALSSAALRQGGPLTPLQQRAVQRITASTDRASRLITDLLDFTRARLGGGIPVEPAPTDLGVLARAVTDELRATHPDRTLQLEVHGATGGTWDAQRAAQALANVIGNALQHGAEGTPVSVDVEDAGPDVEVRVHNAGPAIPPEEIPRLVEPLRRGRGSGTRGGIGLGLYITRAILRAHGGTLSIDSREPDGTTVRLRFPREASPG